jgi:hypothetical protein
LATPQFYEAGNHTGFDDGVPPQQSPSVANGRHIASPAIRAARRL